jgi:hypothetical protein
MLKIDEDAWCEHCGDLESFDTIWDNDGCFWCLDCAKNDHDFKYTEEEIDVALIESMNKKIDYFQKRILFYNGQILKINIRRNNNE